MVAMLLGLIVIAGVTSVFLANQQVYRTNGALSDVQQSTRMSFEMLAQNIREAGLLGCGNNGQVANVLSDGPYGDDSDWWANWSNNLMGYGAGTATNPAFTGANAVTNQVAGTDSLMILSAADVGLTVNTQTSTSTSFSLNGTSTDLVPGAIMIVCDPWQATIFRANSYAGGNLGYGGEWGGNTVNCSTGLAYPTVCGTGNTYIYAANSPIATVAAGVWYLGTNPAGTTSLYLASVNTAAGTVTPQEMVRGVTKMSITYNMANTTSFVQASAVTNWPSVDAVQVNLTLQQSSGPYAGTYTGSSASAAPPIKRVYTVTSTVRNRVQ
ncbi:PilW family protein [Dyella caseinilytica]|uniref:PilW family protein n=2 Tax=Dyella caseinilytica TaxID=1849581 RepID=A0ABX7GZ89_9GAMM|nr:PilW family protein [Dyella caseinilytica]